MAAGFIWAEVEDGVTDRLIAIQEATEAIGQTVVHQTADALVPMLRAAAPLGRHYDAGGGMVAGGTLRESLRWQFGEMGATLLGAYTGLFVIGGTRAHPIRARNVSALRFWWERMGHTFIGVSVRHPGTSPNDFRRKAIDLAFGNGSLTRIWEQALTTWANGGEGSG